MSLSSYTLLSKFDYDNLVFQMLQDFEGPQPYVYADSSFLATIGIGFEITAHPRAILEGMGYSAQSLGPRTFNDLVSALTTAGRASYGLPKTLQVDAVVALGTVSREGQSDPIPPKAPAPSVEYPPHLLRASV